MTRKTWQEFRAAGLLWWVNRALHIFGWSIVVAEDEDTGEVVDVYPARCNWRGFTEEDDEKGFKKLTEYMAAVAPQLEKEVQN